MDIRNFNNGQTRGVNRPQPQNGNSGQTDPNSQQAQQAQQPASLPPIARKGFSQAELENLLRNADTDRDGSVSLEELQSYQQQLFSMQAQLARAGNMDAITRQLDILNLLLTPPENPLFNRIAGLDGDNGGLSYGQPDSDLSRVIGDDGLFSQEDMDRLGAQSPLPGSPPSRGRGITGRPIPPPRNPAGLGSLGPRGGGGRGVSGLDLGGLGLAPEG